MKPKSIVWWWLNVASSGTGNQQLLKAKMDSIKYEEIFGENVMRVVTRLKLGHHHTYNKTMVPRITLPRLGLRVTLEWP